MIWDILEKKISDAGLAVKDVTMFRYHMPAAVKQGVMFKVPLVGIDIDPYLPDYYKPLLQIIVRHDDPAAGDLYAREIMDCVKVDTDEIHPATAERGLVRILRFFPKQLPIHYPRLDGNGFEWSLNFDTAFTLGR